MSQTKSELELHLESDRFDAIASLYSWGLNYDSKDNPFCLFLDLIGWSEEHFGASLYVYATDRRWNLGYMELDYLAGALKVYADTGSDAWDYVEVLLRLESEES